MIGVIAPLAPCPYAIDDVYVTFRTEHPAVRWPGTTWEKIEGRFLLGTGSNAANTDTTFGSLAAGAINRTTVGELGGEAAHTLTAAELANHYHNPQTESGYSFVTTSTDGDGISRHTVSSGSGAANMVRSTNAFSRAGRTGGLTVTGGVGHNNMPPYVTCNMYRRLS